MKKTVLDGACKFCGQIRHVEIAANSGQEEITEAATLNCGCAESIEYKTIKNGKKKINELFMENFPEAAEILTAGVPAVVKGRIKKVTVDTGWNVKGTISIKSDKLNIKREQKVNKESNIS